MTGERIEQLGGCFFVGWVNDGLVSINEI